MCTEILASCSEVRGERLGGEVRRERLGGEVRRERLGGERLGGRG